MTRPGLAGRVGHGPDFLPTRLVPTLSSADIRSVLWSDTSNKFGVLKKGGAIECSPLASSNPPVFSQDYISKIGKVAAAHTKQAVLKDQSLRRAKISRLSKPKRNGTYWAAPTKKDSLRNFDQSLYSEHSHTRSLHILYGSCHISMPKMTKGFLDQSWLFEFNLNASSRMNLMWTTHTKSHLLLLPLLKSLKSVGSNLSVWLG